MRVLLVHASHLDGQGRPYRGRRIWLPGLALPLLAAAAPRRVETVLLNDAVHHLPHDLRWDLVGISAMGVGMFRALQIARRFRQNGSRVVLGGKVLSQHADLVREEVDSVVLGEAEEIWPEVVADAQAGRLLPAYGSAEGLADMGRLPVPRYDLLDRRRHGPVYPIEASRGCPNHCEFCSVSPWGGHQRRPRPIAHVLRDARAVARLGGRMLAFMDDNLTADRAHALELFAALRPLGLAWISQMSTTVLQDGELLEAAAGSGCVGLSIGFESIDQRNLDLAGKTFNRVELYADGVERLRRLGIVVAPLIVVGFDHDTPEGLLGLLDFIDRVPVGLPLLYVLTPAPGTRLHDRLAREGRMLDAPIERYNLMEVVFRPAGMSPKQLEDSFWRVFRRAYSLPRIFSRSVRQGGSIARRLALLLMNLHARQEIRAHLVPGSY